ncbi:class I SAM-dependent methyltransferase [Pararhodobacter sp.]|uniref:class I SAM-dependent methyltransferase n=1 Tax=Pararhodobacter sp. TaxID=2127056 RepID=UPI002FDE6B81
MTALAEKLKARIAATGPLTLAEYMADCLLDPQHGYYATRDPLGAGGDFTTAPEISQMFGELLGLCLAQSWLDQGAPAPFALAEPGPGRGTLMADIWRATRAVPGFHAAARVHLIEASPILRGIQRARLQGLPVTWHDSVGTLPDAPLWLVANEFFDALPIRQFQRDGALWRERVVGLRDGALVLGLTDPAPRSGLAHRLADTTPGDIVETCPASAPVMAALQTRIAAHGGAALIIDYGGWRSLGDTFQALRNHAFDDPLAHPGAADLTAHVDFEALARAAPLLTHSALMPQGALLRQLGIDARAGILARNLRGAALESHRAAHHRLTDAAEMGTLFKALALVAPGAPLPPGFDAV